MATSAPVHVLALHATVRAAIAPSPDDLTAIQCATSTILQAQLSHVVQQHRLVSAALDEAIARASRHESAACDARIRELELARDDALQQLAVARQEATAATREADERMRAMQARLRASENALTVSRNTETSLREAIARLESGARAQKSSHERSVAAVAERSRQEAARAQDESRRAREEVQSAQGARKEAEEQVQEMQASLKSLRHELNTARAALGAMRRRVEESGAALVAVADQKNTQGRPAAAGAEPLSTTPSSSSPSFLQVLSLQQWLSLDPQSVPNLRREVRLYDRFILPPSATRRVRATNLAGTECGASSESLRALYVSADDTMQLFTDATLNASVRLRDQQPQPVLEHDDAPVFFLVQVAIYLSSFVLSGQEYLIKAAALRLGKLCEMLDATLKIAMNFANRSMQMESHLASMVRAARGVARAQGASELRALEMATTDALMHKVELDVAALRRRGAVVQQDLAAAEARRLAMLAECSEASLSMRWYAGAAVELERLNLPGASSRVWSLVGSWLEVWTGIAETVQEERDKRNMGAPPATRVRGRRARAAPEGCAYWGVAMVNMSNLMLALLRTNAPN